MSAFGSSLPEKKRIILKNPDGTFTHCYKADEKDSAAESKSLPANNNENRNSQQEELTLTDSELQYIVDHYDQFEHGNLLEQLLKVLRRNQLIFFLLLLIEMSVTCFLLFITWKKKESSIILLQEIYKDMNSRESSIVFHVIFFLSLMMDCIFYPIGFYSLITKKVKAFKLFSLLALYTGILTLFVIYINILFLFLFVMRLVLYGFTRFLINVLISILLLPRYSLQVANNPNNEDAPNYQGI